MPLIILSIKALDLYSFLKLLFGAFFVCFQMRQQTKSNNLGAAQTFGRVFTTRWLAGKDFFWSAYPVIRSDYNGQKLIMTQSNLLPWLYKTSLITEQNIKLLSPACAWPLGHWDPGDFSREDWVGGIDDDNKMTKLWQWWRFDDNGD